MYIAIQYSLSFSIHVRPECIVLHMDRNALHVDRSVLHVACGQHDLVANFL